MTYSQNVTKINRMKAKKKGIEKNFSVLFGNYNGCNRIECPECERSSKIEIG